jgi:hypothetical protein
MKNSSWWLVAVLCLLPAWAAAQGFFWFERDYEEGKKTWKEIEAQIPPYPKAENLIPFETSAAGHQFFIDAPSVSVGDDGVVRYTLLVKTAGGAVNVSFEGMRCETQEQKYYAIGHAGGAWSRARDPQWRRIDLKESNRQHGVLYVDYFCNGSVPVKSARNAIDALKYGPTSLRYQIGR